MTNALCKHVLVQQFKKQWSLIGLVVLLLAVFSLLPLGSAFEFGEDERFQLIMGFLHSKGYVLYQQIWSDQPPLFVILLSWTFKVFGPSLWAARSLAAGFGMGLLICFFLLLRHRLKTQTALLGTFFLLAAPGVLLLSISVMQEVPMFALVLLALLLLFRWQTTGRLSWLLSSGATMGLAAEIKLLALLAVPAVAAELILADSTNNRPRLRQNWLKTCTLWATAAFLIFAVIGVLWGGGSIHSSLLAHTAEQFVPGKPTSADFPLQTKLFTNHIEVLAIAAIGLALVFCQKRWRDFVFPVILLLTVTTVHLIHRPWWNYYYLHFAIPLTWLAGYAASEAINWSVDHFFNEDSRRHKSATWRAIGLCTLLAMASTWSLKRLEVNIKDLRSRPKVADNPIVARMKESADKSRVYTDNSIYAFHAGLLMPPEIAMVTLKRFWSGQITTTKIIDVCRQHTAELIILPTALPTAAMAEWDPFLRESYSHYTNDNQNVLFIKRS